MKARVFIVGLVGGALLAGVLRYPLYEYAPAGWVEGWPPASAGLAQALIGAAALLLVVTGVAAARMSGASNRAGAAAAGAIAGLIAALIAEVWWGGAAAGVWGSRELLAHGLHATRDEAEMLGLLAEAAVSTVCWTYISLWIAFCAGLGLGALGGALAGPGGSPARPMPMLWPTVAVAGMLISILVLLIAIVILALLGPQAQKAADQAGRTLTFPSNWVLDLPAVTYFILFVAWQVMGWLSLRAESAGRLAWRITVFVSGLLPFGLAILIFLTARQAFFAPTVLLGLIISLAIGVLTLRLYWQRKAQPEFHAVVRPLNMRFWALAAALGNAVVVGTILVSTIAAGLNIVLLIIPAINVLSLHDESAAAAQVASMGDSVASMVKVNYTMQASLVGYGGLAWLIATALAAGIMWPIQRWLAGRAAVKEQQNKKGKEE